MRAPDHARETIFEIMISKILTERQLKIAYNALYNSLLNDLKARGLDSPVFADKVLEYMDLWERRQRLRNDISAHGVTVMNEKTGMFVENRCVSLEVQVSRQMLAIFQSLGFKDIAAKASPGGDDDDEL